jgi:hypothetical protein
MVRGITPGASLPDQIPALPLPVQREGKLHVTSSGLNFLFHKMSMVIRVGPNLGDYYKN